MDNKSGWSRLMLSYKLFIYTVCFSDQVELTDINIDSRMTQKALTVTELTYGPPKSCDILCKSKFAADGNILEVVIEVKVRNLHLPVLWKSIRFSALQYQMLFLTFGV